MRYWLNTHWPLRVDEPTAAPHYGVWLQDDKLHAADGMQAGDLVLIYETGSGLTIRERYADGGIKDIPRQRGRQGVVTLARILDRPSQPEGSRPEHYTDGSQRWWRYVAPTTSLNSAGFIPRRVLAQALGYSENYVFRGFGKDRSGLASISEELFLKLQRLFIEATDAQDGATKGAVMRARSSGSRGEGPEHLALKTAIANDPSGFLGEAGLVLWELEYPFPTADKIDIVLKDQFGRFVVVEVEVDCDAAEIIGPLQCAKYRALVSYLHKRRVDEVRAFLVAHTIDPAVELSCSEFGIECRLVSRNALSIHSARALTPPAA